MIKHRLSCLFITTCHTQVSLSANDKTVGPGLQLVLEPEGGSWVSVKSEIFKIWYVHFQTLAWPRPLTRMLHLPFIFFYSDSKVFDNFSVFSFRPPHSSSLPLLGWYVKRSLRPGLGIEVWTTILALHLLGSLVPFECGRLYSTKWPSRPQSSHLILLKTTKTSNFPFNKWNKTAYGVR